MKIQFIYVVTVLLLGGFLVVPSMTKSLCHSVLGKLCAILLILSYFKIDHLAGLLASLFVVLYYQDGMMEGFDTYSPNTVNTNATAQLSQSYVTPVETSQTEASLKEKGTFREKYCHLGKLMYKGYDISKENAGHVFPNLRFSDELCDPCEAGCKYSISEVIDSEVAILPKSSKDWMNVQEDWEKSKEIMANVANELKSDFYDPLYRYYTIVTQ